MAAIRAAWKRVIQVKQFESETLELAVERDYNATDDADLIGAAQALDQGLARAGDLLVLERLQGRETSGAGSTEDPRKLVQVRRPKNMTDPAPDPKVIETIKKDMPVIEDADAPDDFLTL